MHPTRSQIHPSHSSEWPRSSRRSNGSALVLATLATAALLFAMSRHHSPAQRIEAKPAWLSILPWPRDLVALPRDDAVAAPKRKPAQPELARRVAPRLAPNNRDRALQPDRPKASAELRLVPQEPAATSAPEGAAPPQDKGPLRLDAEVMSRAARSSRGAVQSMADSAGRPVDRAAASVSERTATAIDRAKKRPCEESRGMGLLALPGLVWDLATDGCAK